MGIDVHTITDDVDVRTIRPTQDHVLIRLIQKSRSSGGLEIVGGAQTCMIGQVVALGAGVFDEERNCFYPWDLKVGDWVLGMDYVGERLEHYDGPKYRFVRSLGLWAKVRVKDERTKEIAEVEPRMQCVVVEPQDETTWKGIYLANGLNESTNRRGKVVAVGPGPWRKGTPRRDPVAVSVGQQVAFMRAAGAEFEMNGKTLRILVEEDIRCVVEGME